MALTDVEVTTRTLSSLAGRPARRRREGRRRLRSFLSLSREQPERLLNRPFQLWVTALHRESRLLQHLDVGSNACSFSYELPIGSEYGERGRRDRAAVHEWVWHCGIPVSYTHLTLPTNREV